MIAYVIALLLFASPVLAQTRVPCVDESLWDPPVANGTVVGESLTVNGVKYACARCCDCTTDTKRPDPLQCWDHNASAWKPAKCCTNRVNP